MPAAEGDLKEIKYRSSKIPHISCSHYLYKEMYVKKDSNKL